MIDIVCVLDKSGSMGSIRTDTIGSFNTFLQEQQKDADDTRMSLVMFDSEYLPMYSQVPLEDVEELTLQTFAPSGTTALLEAVCKTITDLTKDKVNNDTIFVIITDGHENASKDDFTKEGTKALVESMEKAGWEFHYLGVGIDSFDDAHGIGVYNSKSYDHTADGVRTASLDASGAVASYKVSRTISHDSEN